MENKMENTNNRYTFGGFTFGSQKLFQLLVNVKNYSSVGTSHSLELGLELTTEERLELIKVLINAGQEDKE
jgi:hypothetical protein